MRVILAALCAMVLFLPNEGLSQWSTDPAVNTPVCTAANSSLNQVIRTCSDGAGGVIMVWGDKRKELGNTGGDLFAQRLDVDGNPLWTANGVAVCDTTGEQNAQCIISDGAGGAIIGWVDARTGQYTGNIYVQRISASGQILWDRQGKKLTTGDAWFSMAMAGDGAGGAILSYRIGVNPNGVYAQRINSAGISQWAGSGIAISPAGYHNYPVVAADDSGGAFISWTLTRGDGLSNCYIQRVTSAGLKRYTANGVPFRVQAASQGQNRLVSLGGGAVMAAWYDERGSTNRQIFVQKFSWNGTPLLTAGGKPLTDPNFDPYYLVMSPDGAGGVFIAYWYSHSLRAVGVKGNGQSRWDSSAGVILCAAPNERYFGDITLVEPGRAVVAWYDNRNYTYENNNVDLFAQSIDTLGQLGWPADGISFSSAPDAQYTPMLVPTINRGAIAAWMDNRAGAGYGQYDVYAQRINAHGGLTSVRDENLTPNGFALLQNFPNPFNPVTQIEYELQNEGEVSLVVCDLLGREVAVLVNERQNAGRHSVRVDGSGLASGVYFYRLHSGVKEQVRKMLLLR